MNAGPSFLIRSLHIHRGRPHHDLQRVEEGDTQEAKHSNSIDEEAHGEVESSAFAQGSQTCPSSVSILSETDTAAAMLCGVMANKRPQTLNRPRQEVHSPLRGAAGGEADRNSAMEGRGEGGGLPMSVSVGEGSGESEENSGGRCGESARKRRQELLVTCNRPKRGVDVVRAPPFRSLGGVDATSTRQDTDKRRLQQLLSGPMW